MQDTSTLHCFKCVNIVLTLTKVLNLRTNLFIQILSILICHVLNETLKTVNLII